MRPSSGAGVRVSDLAPVFVGGALGATARVAFSAAFPIEPGSLPWPTMLENVLGAFLLALLATLLLRRSDADRRLRLLLGTGLLGSFTTYSTFAVELHLLFAASAPLVAVVYGAASLLAGLGAALAGVLLARRLDPWPPRRSSAP